MNIGEVINLPDFTGGINRRQTVNALWLADNCLKSVSIGTDLDAGGHKISGLAKGAFNDDAVTFNQSAESHISSHLNRQNVFKYIMESVGESESDQNVIIDIMIELMR